VEKDTNSSFNPRGTLRLAGVVRQRSGIEGMPMETVAGYRGGMGKGRNEGLGGTEAEYARTARQEKPYGHAAIGVEGSRWHVRILPEMGPKKQEREQ